MKLSTHTLVNRILKRIKAIDTYKTLVILNFTVLWVVSVSFGVFDLFLDKVSTGIYIQLLRAFSSLSCHISDLRKKIGNRLLFFPAFCGAE